jgi:hypothetical protein
MWRVKMKKLMKLSGLVSIALMGWSASAGLADVNDALISNKFNVPDTLQLTSAVPGTLQRATLSGRATGVNFAANSFWISLDTGSAISVSARNAAFRFKDEDANIYRLMGSPYIQISGTINGNSLDADMVRILSGPTARLQESFYTDQAQPPFPAGSLAPLHPSEAAVVAASAHTYSAQSTYASRQRQLRQGKQ